MASLTKLMTLYIAAQVLQEYNVDVMTTTVTVSPYAAM
jgi:D-alanyl-D-alanine carboxypeptidase